MLDELGVRIAIDDFGTGYSALGYLRRLPASILKIDKSLTASLLEESRARAITQAVTDLGRGIGLSVVVEGVESPEVAALVRGMGAHYGQGSLFGAARPLADVPGLQAAVAAAAHGHGPTSPRSPRAPHDAPLPVPELSRPQQPAHRAGRP
jgi:EAL domain-containing protein (putative c-di-GMP-specific phosphodiesterase class I)